MVEIILYHIGRAVVDIYMLSQADKVVQQVFLKVFEICQILENIKKC